MSDSKTIIVIQELENNRFILKCERCKGKGIFDPPDPCKVCHGKGAVLVEVNGNTPFVQCARCNGKGIYDPPDPCKSCQGLGAQTISGEMKIIK